MTRIFLIGVTGFVGGTTLTTLLKHGSSSDIKITCLVRRNDRAAVLREKFGVDTVVAGLDDTDVVKKAAAEADVVINAGTSDHEMGAQALVDGLEETFKATGKKGIIIHVSGVASLMIHGDFASDKIYDDLDCAEIRAVPDTRIHRSTDLVITTASERGVVRGYVIMPPVIYGRGTGPFNRTSVQIPLMIRAALKFGKAHYDGKGLGVWGGSHVQDLVDLCLILMNDGMSENPKAPIGDEGYYFTATDTFQWKELAAQIGKRLHAKGAIATAEPHPLSKEEEIAVYGSVEWIPIVFLSSSLSKPVKAYRLGWKPKTTGVFESLDTEYEAVIEEGIENPPPFLASLDTIFGMYSK